MAKHSPLKQILFSLSSDGLLRKRLLAGSLLISLTYVLAFSLSWMQWIHYETETTDEPVRQEDIAQEVQKKPAPLPPEPQTLTRMLKLKSGGTVTSLLQENGVPRQECHQIADVLRPHIPLRDLKVGQVFHLLYDRLSSGDVVLSKLVVQKSFSSDVVIKRNDRGLFVAEIVKHITDRFPVLVAGSIKSCFYDDALRLGLPPSILKQVIQLLGYKFDLQRDFHPNDRFRVLFETVVNRATGKKASGEGVCLFVEVTIRGVCSRIYAYKRHKHPSVDFFDEKGMGVRSHFLRTPLDGARLTSHFGYRTHPILGYTKLHRGIDFAAPKGTPIMAAGDGVVSRACYNGGYGKYVKIRHAGPYATAYAHLSRYATKVRPGTRVKQGQIIGYVGATGRTTGPHLHFELIKNGKPINPRSVRMLPNIKLTGREYVSFKKHMKEIDALYARSVSS